MDHSSNIAKSQYEIGDILEIVYVIKNRKFSDDRWIVSGKYVTKHRGIFYDIINIDAEEKVLKKGQTLKETRVLKYRKLVDAIK